MLDKRGKIKIGLMVFIILIFIIFLLQIQTTFSSEENLKLNKSEIDVKYNVKPPQLATVGRGGGAKSSLLHKPKSLLEEIPETRENKSKKVTDVFRKKNTDIINYNPKILEEFNKTNQTEKIRVIIYYKSNLERDKFADLKEREDYIRGNTKLTFSYIPETEMEIIQTGLEPNYFGAKISKEGFDKLVNDTRIESIYLDAIVSAFLSDSVLLINANDVWNLGYTGVGKTICVIDSGVNKSHSALSGKIVDEYCYCSSPEGNYSYCCSDHTSYNDDAADNNWHGTHVTGIIVSQNSIYKGVAYGANICVVNSNKIELVINFKYEY